jgi:tetratricopeptide (TPR) repeat protein
MWKLLAVALIGASLAAGSCGGGAPAGGPSAADRARRESEALRLYQDALGASVPDKVDKLRRLTALYDDLEIAAKAHLMLVLYLRLDPREVSLRPALTAAQTFAARRPRELSVSEGFKLVAQSALDDGPDGLGEEAYRSWTEWLAARIAEGGPDLGVLHSEAAHAHLLRRRWAEAAASAEAALAALPADALDRRVSLAVMLGDVRAGRLGDLAGGRAMWHHALLIAPLRKDAHGAKATYAEAILEHLCAGPMRIVAARGVVAP